MCPRNTRNAAKKEASIFAAFRVFRGRKNLSRNIPAPRAAAEITMCEETFFLPGKALPADVSTLVGGCNECVVVVHLTVAFHAADRRLINRFWVESFRHILLPCLGAASKA